jgi:hypothetical protein
MYNNLFALVGVGVTGAASICLHKRFIEQLWRNCAYINDTAHLSRLNFVPIFFLFVPLFIRKTEEPILAIDVSLKWTES